MKTVDLGHATATALLAVVLLFTEVSGAARKAPGAEAHPADVAIAWSELAYELARDERLSPPVAARLFGYAGVALWEAVVPGRPHARSLAGQLNGLRKVAGGPRRQIRAGLDWSRAANAAVAATLRGLRPEASPGSLARIDALECALAGEATCAGRGSKRSVRFGRRVARDVLAWAARDGYAEKSACPWVSPTGPGFWQPTPPAFAPALQPCWGELRPFVAATAACEPPPPPPYSTAPDSPFRVEGEEVYRTGVELTDEQRAIALFWADDAGRTGTPPGHWIRIAGDVARARGLSLADAAEAYARVGIAVADAFVSCWKTKFAYAVLRPITYVRETIDPAWTPLLGTPPFPEYTSGHSVQSAASAAVLEDQLGEVAFTDDTHEPLGLPARSFASFDEASSEAAVSRLYGGIHFRSGIENGLAQGRCVGHTIVESIRFSKPR